MSNLYRQQDFSKRFNLEETVARQFIFRHESFCFLGDHKQQRYPFAPIRPIPIRACYRHTAMAWYD